MEELQMEKLGYKKHSYKNKYLKSGIAEIKMFSEKFIREDGSEIRLEIKTSTFQNYYNISYIGFNAEEFERTDGIHGRFHGYHFRDNNNERFTSFEQVQRFMMETYGFRLVKIGETVKHWYC